MNPCDYAQLRAIVQESCAPNKSSWKWKHRRKNVAVLIVDDTIERPTMISLRARGVKEIPWYRGGCFDGQTLRCQASKARSRAEMIAQKLNRVLARECTTGGREATCAP